MNVTKTLFWRITFSINLFTLTYQLTAQSIPEIPFDIDFAGVTVHLNEQGRVRLQREVGRLYADRPGLQRDIESLRQLTPLLEPLLNAGRLPVDYRYAVLPFPGDESTGYWGLTPNRANALKLVMNGAVDERYHPILATETVVAHLSRLHPISDNYVLTLLRYLQDDTLTNRPVDKVNSTYLLLDAQSPLPIWRIIARKLAFEREEPVLRPTQTYLLYDYRNAGSSLRTISRQLRLDEERFRPFNAWLKAGTIPAGKDYPVLIRVTTDEFLDVKSRDDARRKSSVAGQADVGFPVLIRLPRSTVSTLKSAVFYTINDRLGVQAQPCDNVITLAYYGKIKISNLLSYNELSEKDVVQPGQIYYLERKDKRAKIPFHVVQKNQTLREVANVYGVRLKSLLQFNDIQPTQRVQTGRIVWLQTKRPRRQPVQYRQLPVSEVEPATEDSVTTASPALIDSLSTQPVADSVRATAGQTEPVAVSPGEEVVENKPLPDELLDELKEMLKLHVVQPGQTYYRISQLYGVTLRQLYAWNNLSEDIPLEIGDELIVDLTRKRPPVRPGVKVTARPKAPPRPAPTVSAYHIVRAGQTVYRVALIHNVSVPYLMRLNKLTNYTIEIGQRLLIRK